MRLANPQMFASFSFDEHRQLLLADDRKDEALKWYRQPVLGLNLQHRFDEAVWRPDGIDEGLDALLERSVVSMLHDVDRLNICRKQSSALPARAVKVSGDGAITARDSCHHMAWHDDQDFDVCVRRKRRFRN